VSLSCPADPWGSSFDSSRLPPRVTGAVRPPPPDVGSVPAGDTPSGVKDLMGLVWQWTDEFTDDHTRAGLVRGGGAYYAPTGFLPHDGNWYFPSYYGPLPIPPYTSGVVSGTLLTHGKLLLMAPSYDRHGTVGFRCVADAPGAPPPPPPAGCADGTCDGFCDNAQLQACAATLPAGVSLRAPASGKPCGGALGPCATPADACAPGWALCLSDFAVPALSADGFRSRLGAAACGGGAGGRFVAAMSHAGAACLDAPSAVDFGCNPTGFGAEAICCGAGCVRAGCVNDFYANATTIYDDQRHGCGNADAAVADGVLCCKLQ
jgi:hypothetical protein